MAFARKQAVANKQERFSLLLLDPGEIYFEDFSVFYYPYDSTLEDAYEQRLRGRLKVCSNSLLFDPQDVSFPIMRFLFRECTKVEQWTPPLLSKIGQEGEVLSVSATQVIEMKEGNIIGPYNFKKVTADFRFALNFVGIGDVLPQITQLFRASTLPTAERNMMVQSIVRSRQSRVSFNTSWLDSLYEKIVLETTGDRITPLVCNPGRIMLTNSRLYFQPFNNADPEPVQKVKLSEISRIIKRRYLLQQVGVEIFSAEDFHIFLVFATETDRNYFFEQVISQPDVQLEDTEQENLTLKWQKGVISNYDYLMYLNSMADRSFNDLTQYPVFPWVIKDYTSDRLDLDNPDTFRELSKPIGALNKQRLEQFQIRYAEMPEPKFLYGSHYSTPGYVLFYLARIAPEYMLCLQNGRFDHADRLFNSIADTWSNCLDGAADVKELIPEFYSLPSDFLVNSQNLDFGVRQDRSKADNVVLPPWASDGNDFIIKMRQALECRYVSEHLHQWIDLVFGYQQQGEAAVKANNVFYYLTYEGAVDLSRISDPNERASLEAQITEFGQTPKQLFTSPHPVREALSPPSNLLLDMRAEVTRLVPTLASPSATPPLRRTAARTVAEPTTVEPTEDIDGGREAATGMSWQHLDRLSVTMTQKLHRENVTAVHLSTDGKTIFSVSQDSTLKVYSIEDQKQIRSINLSSMALSSLAVMPDSKTVVVGSWDNNVYVYSVEYGHVLCTVSAHDDAVSSLCWQNDIMVTSSWDSTVKIWTFIPGCGTKRPLPPSLLGELDHETEVSCVDINSKTGLLVSGTVDGSLVLWNIKDQVSISQHSVHIDAVYCVLFSPDGQRVLSSGADRYMRVLDVTTGTEVYCKDAKEPLRAMVWDGEIVLAGGESGTLYVWDLVQGQPRAKLGCHKGPVTCISVSSDGRAVVTASEDRTITLWRI